ncbi:MAG TPA: TonB-dependent receptor, partial [Candidatus Aquilonibacter sp.]|nr:TonB-dependent receptor [Candidatus Aquilonibacter sp.]
YYHASIYRLIYQGNANTSPTVLLQNLNGTNYKNKVTSSYNNVNLPVAYYDWYNQNETDRLSGLSFQYEHPINTSSDVAFSVDQTNSTTTSFSQGMNVNTTSFTSDQFKNATKATPSVNIPTGSSQLFTTYLLRYTNNFNDKWNGVLSLYDNQYQSDVPYQCYDTTKGTSFTAPCAVDGSNALFTTQRTSHFDERVGLTYRPRNDTALRFAMGSAIAPPYLNLIARTNAVSYRNGSPNATQTVNAANLKPETAFGYDLGADHRFKDGVTVLSVDGYLTNLYNHFIASTYLDPNLCTNVYPYANTGCPAAGVPMYDTTNVNLSNARFEGIELQLRRTPAEGIGYNLSASTQRGYAYNLPANFYCSNPAKPCVPANYDTNLGVVPNVNFTGGALNNTGPGLNGLSNQNIPYLQGNLEVNYRMRNGAFFALGETLYGKNNSLNEPPFGVAYTTLIYPISHSLSLQISGDNITNAYSGLFPYTGQGVAVPLAVPGLGATTANVLGPATWRFMLTKNIGPEPLNQ